MKSSYLKCVFTLPLINMLRIIFKTFTVSGAKARKSVIFYNTFLILDYF